MAWEKYFAAWVIIIKNFYLINSIPAQALATPFWFCIFFITAFFRSWPQLFLVFLASFLKINACSYKQLSAYKNIYPWTLHECFIVHISMELTIKSMLLLSAYKNIYSRNLHECFLSISLSMIVLNRRDWLWLPRKQAWKTAL